ncbi:hypothetical protein [Amycolatopsis albispora]|uniref:hypothetical protein n=1 Tax=Amycolatopsis albispora TaxID=1804986 RepID=UPI0013B4185F|nr:hypothetical protein [Amycolatopsis albispora]
MRTAVDSRKKESSEKKEVSSSLANSPGRHRVSVGSSDSGEKKKAGVSRSADGAGPSAGSGAGLKRVSTHSKDDRSRTAESRPESQAERKKRDDALRDLQRTAPGRADYADAQKGGNPGTGLKRQLERAKEDAAEARRDAGQGSAQRVTKTEAEVKRLEVRQAREAEATKKQREKYGPPMPGPRDPERTSPKEVRGKTPIEEALKSLGQPRPVSVEDRMLSPRPESQAERKKRDDALRDLQRTAPGRADYAEAQKGGNPGTGLTRQLGQAREDAAEAQRKADATGFGFSEQVRNTRAEVKRLEERQAPAARHGGPAAQPGQAPVSALPASRTMRSAATLGSLDPADKQNTIRPASTRTRPAQHTPDLDGGIGDLIGPGGGMGVEFLRQRVPGAVVNGPTHGFEPIPPDGKGGFGGFKAHANVGDVTFLNPPINRHGGPATTIGEASYGADIEVTGGISPKDGAKLEAQTFLGLRGAGAEQNYQSGPLNVGGQAETKLGLHLGGTVGATPRDGLEAEVEALAGSKVQLNEYKDDFGPLTLSAQPEAWSGFGGTAGLGVEKGEDGNWHLKGRAGVSPGIGGAMNFDVGVDLKPVEDVFNQAAALLGGG